MEFVAAAEPDAMDVEQEDSSGKKCQKCDGMSELLSIAAFECRRRKLAGWPKVKSPWLLNF